MARRTPAGSGGAAKQQQQPHPQRGVLSRLYFFFFSFFAEGAEGAEQRGAQLPCSRGCRAQRFGEGGSPEEVTREAALFVLLPQPYGGEPGVVGGVTMAEDDAGWPLLQRSNSISLNVDGLINQLLSARGERARDGLSRRPPVPAVFR